MQNFTRSNLTSKTPETVVSSSPVPREATSENLEMDTIPHASICTTPMVGNHRKETSTADKSVVLADMSSGNLICLDDSVVESSQNVSTFATPAAPLIAQNSNCSVITVSSDGSDARNNHTKDLQFVEEEPNDIFDEEYDTSDDMFSLSADDTLDHGKLAYFVVNF